MLPLFIWCREVEMGEARRRSLLQPLISVLIPERGRPAELRRCIVSLIETAGADARIELLVAIDRDDETWTAASIAELEWQSSTTVRVFYWERPITLGEKLNLLYQQSRGAIIAWLANDYVMETQGWPDIVRAEAARLPNGIGILFPHDDLHPDHAAFPIMTKRMVDAVGFFAAPWFGIPWFAADTWHDELGILLGIRREIAVTVRAPEGRGKTQGMIDLAFWTRFFNETRALRARDAVNLASTAYGDGTPEFNAVKAVAGERLALCERRTAHLSSPAFVAHWEANGASPPSADYPKVRAHAERLLADLRSKTPRRLRVEVAVPSGLNWNANTAACIASLAANATMHGIEIAILNMQSSVISNSRNAIVEIALKHDCDFILFVDSDMGFPADSLLRLLKYNKDIVGATYNKRVVDPKTGKYPTLGLFDCKPEDLADDLNPMMHLPSGMLLVKTDVFRALGWPYYAEAFRWPGADGLDAFKKLLRNYFVKTPPEEALADLDDTAFGAWVRDNYAVGTVADGSHHCSEDVWFCARARKAGFTIWCSLALTYDMKHYAEIAVTTLKPETKAAAVSEAAD